MSESSEHAGAERWARRAPMFLSAFVCPGAGQLMQKRWLAAAIYGVAFLAPFFYLAGYVMYRMFTNITNAIEDRPVEPLSFVKIIAPFLIAMVVWVAGLFDTHFAEKRLRTKSEVQVQP